MVITHSKNLSEIANIKRFWFATFRHWFSIMKPLLNTKYMHALISFLTLEYKGYDNIIYPSSKQVFRAFNLCPFNKCKVVILGDPPEVDGTANGLVYGCDTTQWEDPCENLLQLPNETSVKLEEGVEADVKLTNIDLDYSLESWAKQGVLLLGTALTSSHDLGGTAHAKHWKFFTRYVIRKISEKDENIIFLLWGVDSYKFREVINKKSTVFVSTSPKYATLVNRVWTPLCFSLANKKLKELGKKPIEW